MRKAFIRKLEQFHQQLLLWSDKYTLHLGLRGKTLWDWLQLLIIPAVLAAAALLFDQSQQVRTQDIEATRISEQQRIEYDRAKEQKHIEATRISEQQRIEDDRAKEQNLQSYYDDMADLLLGQNLRNKPPESEARTLARAQTLATLRTLDSERKGLLIKFLSETKLIQKQINENGTPDNPIIDLRGADLRGAKLSGANLRGAVLSLADLSEADMRWADLSGADLMGAVLSEANLGEANLFKVNLGSANLSGANLGWAYLGEADLSRAFLSLSDLRGAKLGEADLRGANLSLSDLRGADLRGAKLSGANLSGTDLSGADLSWAIMPDGKKYDPAIHILTTPTPSSP